MKIEVGKRYVMRGGGVTLPMQSHAPPDNERYPFVASGSPLHKGTAAWWAADGRYFVDDPVEHPSDLIAEYVEPTADPFDVLREPDVYDAAARDALDEVRRAKSMWPGNFNTAHEGYAILAEEVDELWGHVKTNQKRRDLAAMRKEAIQVAAMALRFAAECCDEATGRK